MGNRIIVAAKDIGAARLTIPVALALQERGFEIHVAAKGRAEEMYKEYSARFSRIITANADTAIQGLAPSAVITGLSWPLAVDGVAVEEEYGLAANRADVHLIRIEDLWGASGARSHAHPDVIATIDEAAVEIARARYPSARVLLAGNPGVLGAPYKATGDIQAKVEKLASKRGPIVLLSLGIEHDVAEAYVACVEKTAKELYTLVSFHPKLFVPGGDIIPELGVKYISHYNRALSPLFGQWQAITGKVEDYAVCADLVVTGASTLLLTAAQAGKATLSLFTPITRHAIKESSGLDYYPPACYGMPLTEGPVDLAGYMRPPAASLVAALRPYDPQTVVDAVVRLAS